MEVDGSGEEFEWLVHDEEYDDRVGCWCYELWDGGECCSEPFWDCFDCLVCDVVLVDEVGEVCGEKEND